MTIERDRARINPLDGARTVADSLSIPIDRLHLRHARAHSPPSSLAGLRPTRDAVERDERVPGRRARVGRERGPCG